MAAIGLGLNGHARSARIVLPLKSASQMTTAARPLRPLPLLDRLTHHYDIVETGNESWQFKNRA